jgi:hypothetical protein
LRSRLRAAFFVLVTRRRKTKKHGPALLGRRRRQKAKTGRVRVIVLKARQLGVSTYVAAGFSHKTISNAGLRTIIIGHEKRASTNLFQLVKRFHEHMRDDYRRSIGR